MILISHSKSIVETLDNGMVVEHVMPAAPDRCSQIINRLVDINGYIKVSWKENNEISRTLLTRATPTIMAGSRLKYLDPEIPFGYNELVDAVNRAVDKELAEKDGSVSAEVAAPVEKEIKKLPFTEIRKEAQEIWSDLVGQNPQNSEVILNKVEEIFGKRIRLSSITEDQADKFYVLLQAMRALNSNS